MINWIQYQRAKQALVRRQNPVIYDPDSRFDGSLGAVRRGRNPQTGKPIRIRGPASLGYDSAAELANETGCTSSSTQGYMCVVGSMSKPIAAWDAAIGVLANFNKNILPKTLVSHPTFASQNDLTTSLIASTNSTISKMRSISGKLKSIQAGLAEDAKKWDDLYAEVKAEYADPDRAYGTADLLTQTNAQYRERVQSFAYPIVDLVVQGEKIADSMVSWVNSYNAFNASSAATAWKGWHDTLDAWDRSLEGPLDMLGRGLGVLVKWGLYVVGALMLFQLAPGLLNSRR